MKNKKNYVTFIDVYAIIFSLFLLYLFGIWINNNIGEHLTYESGFIAGIVTAIMIFLINDARLILSDLK